MYNSILLIIFLVYLFWLVWRGISNKTNILLRCASCGRMGTMKKTSSPKEESIFSEDLLDEKNMDREEYQHYIYTCIHCGAEAHL